MDDRQIIELYYQRDDNAIKETSDKYGNYCFSIANNILACKQDSENVSTILGFKLGTVFHRKSQIV